MMKTVQTQKLQESVQENPFKMIAEAFNSFKKKCRKAAKQDPKFERQVYEFEKKIKYESDMQKLKRSGPRLQNYELPKDSNSLKNFDYTGFHIKVKPSARLYEEWEVAKISIVYPEDCYAPLVRDRIKNCIRGITPWTIEIALLDDKGKILTNHPLFKDSMLPRFYNYLELIDYLDQLAVSDNVKRNNKYISFNFMEEENKYFEK